MLKMLNLVDQLDTEVKSLKNQLTSNEKETRILKNLVTNVLQKRECKCECISKHAADERPLGTNSSTQTLPCESVPSTQTTSTDIVSSATIPSKSPSPQSRSILSSENNQPPPSNDPTVKSSSSHPRSIPSIVCPSSSDVNKPLREQSFSTEEDTAKLEYLIQKTVRTSVKVSEKKRKIVVFNAPKNVQFYQLAEFLLALASSLSLQMSLGDIVNTEQSHSGPLIVTLSSPCLAQLFEYRAPLLRFTPFNRIGVRRERERMSQEIT